MIDSNKININSATVVIDKQSSKMNQKRLSKSLWMIIKFLLLFALILIIGLIISTSICLIKTDRLKKELRAKDTIISIEQANNKNCSKANQQLTNLLNFNKQMSSKLNKRILFSKIYCLTISNLFKKYFSILKIKLNKLNQFAIIF